MDIEQMRILRKKGQSYGQIGKQCNLTGERVRQILVGRLKSLSVEEVVRAYKKVVKSFSDIKVLESEIERLSTQSRKKERVVERAMLCKYLIKKHKMSYSAIGRLLKRDHTTILKLCRKDV